MGATLSAGVVGDPVNGKVCSVVVACVQFGLGVYGGGGGIVNLSLSDIALESGVSDSVGVFANGGVGGLSAGGSMNIGEGFLGGARGFAGGGIGLSFGIQACSASLNCTGE